MSKILEYRHGFAEQFLISSRIVGERLFSVDLAPA